MNLNIFQRRSLKTRVTLFTLAIFVISIWSLAFYASRMLRVDMERLLGEQQISTVSFIAEVVNGALEDRLRALEAVGGSVSPAMLGNTATMQPILEQRPILQSLFNGGVIAYRLDGTAIADVPLSAGRIGVNYMDIDTVAAALKEGKATIGRPVMGRKLRAPVFGMTVPIRDTQGRVVGALAGVTNLGLPNFLDKITENRYGKTGGYLLAERKHRMIVTATDKSRIMRQLPAAGVIPEVDRAIRGEEGSAVFVNALGVEVLASGKGVPVAGWYVSAGMPTAEAFAPIHAMQQRMLLATIFLTLLAGGLTWWMLRRQLAPMLATVKTLAGLSDTNEPPLPLPIARQDEVGQLIGGFNRMMETLGKREDSLRESEAQNRAITQSAHDAIITADSAGIVVSWNRGAEVLFGYTESEVMGQPMTLLMPERYCDGHLAGMHRIRSGGEPHIIGKAVELNGLRKDGSEFPLELSLAKWETTEAWFVTGIVRDITERKQAGEALARESHRNEVLLRHASDGIHILDADGDVLEVSDAFCEMLGYSRGELIGANVSLWDAHWSSQELKQVIAEQMAKEGRSVLETRHRRRDGSILDVEVTGQGLELDGKPVLFNSARDITERIRTQVELRTLSRAVEQSPASIVITDRAGNIAYVNPRFEQVTGYTRAEAVGRNPRILKSDTTPAEKYCDLWKAISEGGEWRGELCNRRKNGELFWEFAAISGLKDESGEVSHYIAVKENITERKQAEAELEQHRHHLEELVVSRTSDLAMAHEAAEVAHRASEERLRVETEAKMESRKLEAVGTLAAGIAHDFNNILGSIVGFAEMTADDLPDGSSAKHNVAQILSASFRARDLIARMLAFARQSPPQPVAVDVVAQVREALALLRASLPPSVQLAFQSGIDEAGAPATILADPTQIQQIVMNLCINAGHAMDDQGVIRIDVDPAGKVKGAPPRHVDGICLTVADNGSGVTPEVLERMFDPFFTTKAPSKGSGLGLSVVYGIVTGLGGVIEVQSRVDGSDTGTEFRVFLPLEKNKLPTGEIHGAHIAD